MGSEQWHAVVGLLAKALRHMLKAEAWPLYRDAPTRRMKRPVEFAAAASASRASQDRYRLSPREAYVLRSAPIRGVGLAGKARRHGEAVLGDARTMWMIGDEHLSDVVERLLLRGFLARRRGAAPAYADLTAEGREALQARQTEALR